MCVWIQVTLELVQNTTPDDIQWWSRSSMAGMGFADANDPAQLLAQPSDQHMATPPAVQVICHASVRIHVSEPKGIISALWQGGSSMDAYFAYAQVVRLGGHMEFTARRHVPCGVIAANALAHQSSIRLRGVLTRPGLLYMNSCNMMLQSTPPAASQAMQAVGAWLGDDAVDTGCFRTLCCRTQQCT